MPIINAPENMQLLLEDVTVRYSQRGGSAVAAAAAARLALESGALIAISGPSGSGKTTLLHVLAGLLQPSTGMVRWGADTLTSMSEAARDRWRRAKIGLVFQDFHLVPELSAVDNVLLPIWFSQWRAAPDQVQRATGLLRRMGVPDAHRRAGLLSRGEQQRVAIARALVGRPSLILADEPTASLDSESGAVVAELLIDAARQAQATMIVVSHDPAMLARFDLVRRMDKGVLLA